MKKIIASFFSLLMLASVLSAAPKKDIVDTAVGAGSFKTLVAAVKAAGLVDTLKGDGPFTVFAPTDEAFGKLSKCTLDSLLKPENKHKLAAILTYHVVPGKVKAKRRFYETKANDQMDAVNAQLMKNSDSRMPITNSSRSVTTRGRQPSFQD